MQTKLCLLLMPISVSTLLTHVGSIAILRNQALGHPPAEPRDLALRTVGGEHMDVTCASQRAAMGTDSCHF